MTVLAWNVKQNEHFVAVLSALREGQDSQDDLLMIEILVNIQAYNSL